MAGRVAGNRRPGWSELQGDLLELILEKLDLADHARFASVCSSWRSVAVKNPPINKPIYFALSHEPRRNLLRRFIISFLPSWDTCWFIGALDGWLVILIDRKDLFLLNKGFNSIIPLPPPPKDFFQTIKLCKAVLSSPPSSSSSSSSSSSGECTVVVIKHFYAGLFYCRLVSDKSFIKLSDITHWLEDILFYKGRLYVIWCDSHLNTNNITIFDHLLNKVTQLVTHFGDGPLHYSHYRLLISENKLLITAGRFNPVVFELEASESRFIRVENINDNLLLLLNSFCSVSITTNEHKEFHRTNNFYLNEICATFVLDTGEGEDFTEAKEGDPLPLFFVMFRNQEIMNCVEQTIM